MPDYKAPLDDMKFVLFDVLEANRLADIPGYEDASEDIMRAILDEAAKLNESVLAPINASGDTEGCSYDPQTHAVKTPEGFKEAYQQFSQGGWTGLTADPEYGGQGLPHLLKLCLNEMVCSANFSIGMYPGLSHGAIDAVTQHANDELKQQYLPNLVSGRWSGTMCLTEPQCGTDLGLITTRANLNADGSYALTGTKIWITGGEQDLTENIIHLVLAKLPDAPDSTRGISLFLVPKILSDGSRNPVFCGGLEHKMGINGSSTCVMNFEGAQGWLVGEENKGLKCMFTMMNAARIMVGIQGLGAAEAAYQISLGFCRERLQSRSVSGPQNPNGKADPIIVHPDVRRMLAQQKAFIEGARAMAYWTGYQLDLSHKHPDPDERQRADDLVQIMTPLVKAHLTDEGYLSIDQALQSMGGSGFTKDWGVEQLQRDSRISRIYEGTNGIQALDLVGRKLLIRDGRLPGAFITAMRELLTTATNTSYVGHADHCLSAVEEALGWIGENAFTDPEQGAAAATPLLKLFSVTAMSVFWAVLDAKAGEGLADNGSYSQTFYSGKQKAAAHFYRIAMPLVNGYLEDIRAGKATLMAFTDNEF
ncbi:3-methylmercaptopropionyl-CoA dehydrogenase [BD1-7 clade bacterium]|uniref:3-methylmercaptopropionyl-CoA dehydrogenase n=1 Tax=BD1-7 clade bacterium TaxID=2029982 RepID=A0A5S9Q0W5_9GAMM|nr:3-methylmercaptopropionyl-CoA dehydrogenase [BD1-7 clade bacterium]